MRWSDAQQTMLRAMGLRLWLPGEVPEPVVTPKPLRELQPLARLAATPADAGPASPAAGPAATSTARAPMDAPAGQRSSPPIRQPARQPPNAPITPITPSTSITPSTAMARAAASGPKPRSALDSLDWPALRSAVADCRACGLVDCRQQSVFGGGPLRADCLIVGESQGEQEDASGAPFAGDAGPLLDRMLRALGLSRAEAEPADSPPDPGRRVFVTNEIGRAHV